MTDTEKLDDAFRVGLGLGDDVGLEELTYGHADGWDSIAHMQLVVAIERAFGIMLDTEDVVGMSSYRVARRILRDNHGIDVDA
jgi:hypothetical protein